MELSSAVRWLLSCRPRPMCQLGCSVTDDHSPFERNMLTRALNVNKSSFGSYIGTICPGGLFEHPKRGAVKTWSNHAALFESVAVATERATLARTCKSAPRWHGDKVTRRHSETTRLGGTPAAALCAMFAAAKTADASSAASEPEFDAGCAVHILPQATRPPSLTPA